MNSAGIRSPMEVYNPKAPTRTLGARTILLVEDDVDLRTALRRFLELTEPHFHLLVAGSAGEALEVLHATHVDTVVSDLRLPGRDGLTFLEEVAQQRPRARRILITGYPSSPEFARAVNRGRIDGFLLKPFEPDTFLELLRRVSYGSQERGFGRIPPLP